MSLLSASSGQIVGCQDKNNPTPIKKSGRFASAQAILAQPTTAQDLSGLWASSSFKAGFGIIAQDTALVTIPKVLFGLLFRHSAYIGMYEALVDAFDAIGLYILPTSVALLQAPIFAKATEIPDPVLLGKPLEELKSRLGEELVMEGGRLRHTVDYALINRVGKAKTIQFLSIAGFGCAAEFIATALRALIFPLITKIDNFYAIAGLPVADDQQKRGGEEAKAAQVRAKENLKKALLFLAISIPGLLGLSFVLNKISKPITHKFDRWTGFSTYFDVGKGFGISKMATLPNLALSIPAFMSVAYNRAGALEDCMRLLCVTIPSVLFFNQIAANLLAASFMRFKHQTKDLLLPWSQIRQEMLVGRREFFDLNAIDYEYIAKHPNFQKLSVEKQLSLKKDFHFSQNQGVFMLAIVLGIIANFANMLRTRDLHENEQKSADKNTTTPIPISPKIL